MLGRLRNGDVLSLHPASTLARLILERIDFVARPLDAYINAHDMVRNVSRLVLGNGERFANVLYWTSKFGLFESGPTTGQERRVIAERERKWETFITMSTTYLH